MRWGFLGFWSVHSGQPKVSRPPAKHHPRQNIPNRRNKEGKGRYNQKIEDNQMNVKQQQNERTSNLKKTSNTKITIPNQRSNKRKM